MVDDAAPAGHPRAARSGACAPSSGSRAIGEDYDGHHRVRQLPAAAHRPGPLLPARRPGELGALLPAAGTACGCATAPDPVDPLPLDRDPAARPLRSPARRRPVRRRRPASATTRPGRTAAPAAASATTGRRTASASSPRPPQTRRALLERLVPRLTIADRCTLEGRFLLVQGRAPHVQDPPRLGQHPDEPERPVPVHRPEVRPRPAPQAGYLPFEGDRMLAIILSKAMLLADDTKITDPTILSQLCTGPARGPSQVSAAVPDDFTGRRPACVRRLPGDALGPGGARRHRGRHRRSVQQEPATQTGRRAAGRPGPSYAAGCRSRAASAAVASPDPPRWSRRAQVRQNTRGPRFPR